MLSIKKATETVPAKAFCLDFISESTAGTAYPVTSYHLPFIIYHCNSSFNLVSADKAAVISEHTSKSFLGNYVPSWGCIPEKNSFWLRQACVACQSNRNWVNHPTRTLSTLSPATNHNQTIIFQVYRMLFVLSSSVLTQLSPLVLSSSRYTRHTHSANVPSAYSDFINLRGS